MPSTKLSSIIKSKSGGLGLGSGETTEQNIERGKIWTYNTGVHQPNIYQGFCWQAPGFGTAVIELWGASGGSGCMCCCGFGISGNPGAYSKKTITVAPGCFVCGALGKPCQNQGFCFKGCSDASGLVWTGCTGGYGCMCAQGGRGGVTICSTTPSAVCCFIAQGSHCTTLVPDNCGIVCNWSQGWWMACAFGGDVNCCGGISCAQFAGCLPHCICQETHYVKLSPGIFSTGGAMIIHSVENTNGFANWSGQGIGQLTHGLNAASRTPAMGVPFSACWQGVTSCGCYVQCTNRLPAGVPGPASHPCDAVRDDGSNGGVGQVRIRFY